MISPRRVSPIGMLIPMDDLNPYAAPQSDKLDAALLTKQKPGPQPALVTGSELCLKAIVLMLACGGVAIAGVVWHFVLTVPVLLIVYVAAVVCQNEGVVCSAAS